MINIMSAVEELDAELVKMGEAFTLYICGGAALIFLGFGGRKTEDIDAIEQELDPILLKAAARVAKKLGYPSNWLNNDVAPLGDKLGRGWKRKCSIVFKGEGLILKSLSRQDLINSKLHATIERQAKDLPDLVFLAPTNEEIKLASEYALGLGEADGNENYIYLVKAYVKLLKEELGMT